MACITQSYRKHAAMQPDKLAIRCGADRLNYEDWNACVEQTANWLHASGKKRRVIAFLLPNSIPFLQLFAGAARAGWTALPLDGKWTNVEIAARLDVAKPSIVVGPSEQFADGMNKMTIAECLQEISHMPTRYMADSHSGKEPFYMGFTSGTTGVPKAFLRSGQSWVSSFICSETDFGIGSEDQILIPGALVHSHFLYGAIHALHTGASIEVLEKFSAHKVKEKLESSSLDTVYVVPTMIEALLHESIQLTGKVKAISSGAKLQDEKKQAIANAGFAAYELYGASELSFVTVKTDADEIGNSVGKACTDVEIEIRKANGAVAECGEVGKIFVRSNLLFDGYLRDDGGLDPMRDDRGFITVDDMGTLEKSGYLHIAGREKNMILYGALNIFPEEIERLLERYPHVNEAAVIGIQDEYWGELAVGIICGKARKLELQRWCKEEGLAAYKIPRRFCFIDKMPYTTSGKIARAELKRMLERGELH